MTEKGSFEVDLLRTLELLIEVLKDQPLASTRCCLARECCAFELQQLQSS